MRGEGHSWCRLPEPAEERWGLMRPGSAWPCGWRAVGPWPVPALTWHEEVWPLRPTPHLWPWRPLTHRTAPLESYLLQGLYSQVLSGHSDALECSQSRSFSPKGWETGRVGCCLGKRMPLWGPAPPQGLFRCLFTAHTYSVV